MIRVLIISIFLQGMPNISGCTKEGAAKGGYTIVDCDGTPDVILIGTGSELGMVVEAGEKLAAEGTKVDDITMLT